MAEIATPVTEITVEEPLLSQTNVTLPVLSAGGDRNQTRGRMLLSRFPGRRGASMVVRENVALEMEDYREDIGYSFPVVLLYTLWNLALVLFAVATLIATAREETDVKIRVWICGYLMQCLIQLVQLLSEYRRRNLRISTASRVPTLISSSSSSDDDGDRVTPIRRLETLITVISYMWWVIGFILMLYSHGNHGTERLYWLTLAFLAMDMFFFVLRYLTILLLSAGYCFCLPCIIAIMIYISCQERASEDDISIVPKYTFKVSSDDVEQPGVRTCKMILTGTNAPEFSRERVLPIEDADCCICLCHYEDKEELHLLRCRHHFHSACIRKWLRVKATCPVCKSLVE